MGLISWQRYQFKSRKLLLIFFFFFFLHHYASFSNLFPRIVSRCDTTDLGADDKLTCRLSDRAAAVKTLLWARRFQHHSPLRFVAKEWIMRKKNLLGLFVYVPWPDNHHHYSRIVWNETRNHTYSAVYSLTKLFFVERCSRLSVSHGWYSK